jgi:hypothetical protein
VNDEACQKQKQGNEILEMGSQWAEENAPRRTRGNTNHSFDKFSACRSSLAEAYQLIPTHCAGVAGASLGELLAFLP